MTRSAPTRRCRSSCIPRRCGRWGSSASCASAARPGRCWPACEPAAGCAELRSIPFGRTAIRRLERELIDEHRTLVRSALRWLTPDTQDDVAAVAAVADLIRGYEQIKLANVDRYRVAAAEALAALAVSPVEVSLSP